MSPAESSCPWLRRSTESHEDFITYFPGELSTEAPENPVFPKPPAAAPSGRPGTLASLGVLVLALGTLIFSWRVFWPDPDRDFNHLHGWGWCEVSLLARNLAHIGALETGLAPVAYQYHDTGGHYMYYLHHPPLIPLAVSLLFHGGANSHPHARVRWASFAFALTFVAMMYLLGRELEGDRLAAWAAFFSAINAEQFFFGSSAVLNGFFWSSFAAALSYWTYWRWRSTGRQVYLAVCVLSLCAGLLAEWFSFFVPLPIAIDLLAFSPERGRRRRRLAVFLLLLPPVMFLLIQSYYRYGLSLLAGKAVHAAQFTQSLAARTHWELLWSFAFYKSVLDSVFWYFSPAAFIAAVAFVVTRRFAFDRPRRTGTSEAERKQAFIVFSLLIGAPLLLLPRSTIDHQFSYALLLLPLPLAAAAGLAFVRSRPVQAVVMVTTLLSASASASELSATNNSPRWEFETGVAANLFTPPGSFLKVPLDGDLLYPMLLFYGDREFIFPPPPEIQPAPIHSRFELITGPFHDAAACPLYLPANSTTLVDREPGLRARLPRRGGTYDGGALEILGAQTTGSYGDLRLVELEWVAHARTPEPLELELVQTGGGSYAPLGTFGFRGNTLDSSQAETERPYRDAYLVTARGTGPVSIRLFEKTQRRYRRSDSGMLDIPASGGLLP